MCGFGSADPDQVSDLALVRSNDDGSGTAQTPSNNPLEAAHSFEQSSRAVRRAFSFGKGILRGTLGVPLGRALGRQGFGVRSSSGLKRVKEKHSKHYRGK